MCGRRRWRRIGPASRPSSASARRRGERRAGLTLDVVARQLAGSLPDKATARDTVIAYEPVWAIGTGLTATLADVAEVHAFLRQALTSASARRARPCASCTADR